MSANGGQTWSSVTNFTFDTDVLDVAPYPVTDGTHNAWLWATGYGTVDGIFFSSDNGTSWDENPAMTTYEWQTIDAVHVADDSPTLIAGTKDGKIFRKVGTGSYNQVESNISFGSINMIRHNGSTFYAATDDGLYLSTNVGANWGKVTAFPNSFKSVAVADNGLAFASTANAVYTSTDGGANWTEIGVMSVSSVTGAVANDVLTLFAASPTTSISSTYSSSSSSWADTQLTSNDVYAEMIFWKPDTKHRFIAGYTAAGPRILRNSGSEWQVKYDPTSSGDKMLGFVAHPATANYIYAYGRANAYNLFLSTDDGATWNPTSNVGGASDKVNALIGFTQSNAVKAVAALSDGRVFLSPDGFGSFGGTPVLSGGGGLVAYTIAQNPASGQESKIYVGRSDGVWKSTNTGSSFSQVKSDRSVEKIVIHPTYLSDANHWFAITNDGDKLYRTNDGFSTWSEISTSEIPKPMKALSAPANAGFLYVATPKGVYALDIEPTPPTNVPSLSTVDANNHPKIMWDDHPTLDIASFDVYKYYYSCWWELTSKGWGIVCNDPTTPEYVGSASGSSTYFVDNSEDVISIPGHGYSWLSAHYFVYAVDGANNYSAASGEKSYNVNDGAEEDRAGLGRDHVDELGSNAKPVAYSLSSNFPNPFNPSTEIHYALPEDVHVRLRVYDMLGREVATLVDSFEQAGYKSVRFDASSLPSGIYIYILNAGNFRDAKKMMFAK